MSQEFIPGQRYILTEHMADTVMRAGWPITHGMPDLCRGRLFLAMPGKWAFWLTTGIRVDFEVLPTGGYIVSQGREPDPERPEPLEAS